MTADAAGALLWIGALFVLLAPAALGAGRFVVPRLSGASRFELGLLRAIAGLAVLGSSAFALGTLGLLRPAPLALLCGVAVVAGLFAIRAGRVSERGSDPASGREPADRTGSALPLAVGAIAFVPLFGLALYPPLAFDETLYHLPTVRRIAESGALPFLAELRVPVGPQLDEVLRVPLFLFGGERATHLLPLFATLLTAALLGGAAARAGGYRAASFAAAILLSSPLVAILATTGYVEALLTLFVVAALHTFDRWRETEGTGWLVASGLFAGAAAAVKYFGLLWLALLVLAVLARTVRPQSPHARRKALAVFAAAALVVALPWYARIACTAGNPLFPFAGELFGASAWDPPTTARISERSQGLSAVLARRLFDLARLPWDSYFARARLNHQPPFSPWLLVGLPAVFLAARRDRRTRELAVLVVGWALVWALFLPHDARFLLPVLPLAALAVARTLAAWPLVARCSARACAALAIVLVLPGPLYAAYRFRRLGAPPATPAAREAFLLRTLPGYGGLAVLNRLSSRDDLAYVCGGEWLHYYYRGRMLGDVTGPASYSRLAATRTSDALAAWLDELGVRHFATLGPRCPVSPLDDAVAAGVLVPVATVPGTLPLPGNSIASTPGALPSTMRIFVVAERGEPDRRVP